MDKVFLKYLPHGISTKFFFKPTTEEDIKAATELRGRMFNNEAVDFVVMYNSRNIRRKMTGDVVLAYRKFILGLTEERRDRCRLLMHTQPVDDNGTDLPALIRDCAPEIKVVFSTDRVDSRTMNLIYANADVVINLASNEGFGLGTLEALMCEKMIVANVTGGLQDQMGFQDDKGNLLHEDVHFDADFGSNHFGRYRTHGEWVVPVFPNNMALIGSPPTPYIFDDRCDWREAGNALRTIYDMSPDERARRGALGRQYALDMGMTAEEMGQRFIEGFDAVMANWKPRKRFVMVKG
jgi:glycosyltransferase involved in cell wall biosynthesis